MGKSTTPLTHAESVRRLIREFGADIQVRISPPKSEDYTAMKRRNAQKAVYKMFPEKDIYGFDFSEGGLPWVTVLWDYAQPYDSPSRTSMRRSLAEFGVWEPRVSHLWCVPEALGRPPLAQDLATYRPFLLNALSAAGSKYVILVGTRPMWMWRPEMKLKMVQGKMFVWRSRYMVYPVANPLAMQKHEYRSWRNQIEKFCYYVMNDMDTEAVSADCIDCGERVYWYDADGVPWCREHYEAGEALERKGVREWQTQVINAGNREMFPDGV